MQLRLRLYWHVCRRWLLPSAAPLPVGAPSGCENVLAWFAPRAVLLREPGQCSELRQAIIQKTIRVGMKAADVKRSWGEPTRVRRAHPGDDEWEYWHPAGDQIVSIGPDGCVTGWRTARD